MGISKIIALMLSALFMFTSSGEVKTVNFTVAESTEPVRNPHKGWVQYVYWTGIYDDPVYGTENNGSWDFSTVAYSRFMWSDIEKEKGVYDWSAVDAMIEAADSHGMTFGFGIVPADSLQNKPEGFVPQYVYDEGCEYVIAETENSGVKSTQRTPVWSDETYLEASFRLAAAIAERYDGDDRVEFIDIRTLGNWGEWHTWALTGSEFPSESVQKRVLDAWAALFDETQLVMPVNDDKPTAMSEYAVSLGITLRRDGLVAIEGAENALADATDANLPAVGETCSGYRSMRDDGTWTDEKLSTSVRGGKVSYMALAGDVTDGYELYTERTEIVEQLQNEIGYNFVVRSASASYSGETAFVRITVENTGLAPQYFPLSIKLAVTDENGENAEILTQTVFAESGAFGSGETKTYTFAVDSSKLKSGSALAAGLFENTAEASPDVLFCNKNTAENGWLLLGTL